jgi:HK97 family phage major capsid protein
MELHDKVDQLREQALAMVNLSKEEKRKLNADEENQFNQINMEIASLQSEIEARNNKNTNLEKRNNKMENFSLIKAIYNVANNQQMNERAASVVAEGVAEMRKAGLSYSGQIQLPVEERSIVAGVETAGAEVVATDKLNILEPLRANLVMNAAGATFMTGLVGNISIPTYSGSTCGWEGEIDAANNGKGSFGSVELSPKRLTAYLDISKQFLIQDSASAEEMLKADIVRAISNKLEATILGAEAGDNKKPAGLFVDATKVESFDYATLVNMVADLENKDVNGDMKFIVNPSIKALLKSTPIDKGSGRFLMMNNEIDGLPVLSTSASEGIVLGSFSDYVIAQWGGIDLTVDPYTKSAEGKIRLVINTYFDAKPRRDSFVCKTV